MHGLEEKAADAGVGTEVWEVCCSGEIHRVALVGRKLAFLDHPKGAFRGIRMLDVDPDDENVPGCLRFLKKYQRCLHLDEYENHLELAQMGWANEWELDEQEKRLLEVERRNRQLRDVRREWYKEWYDCDPLEQPISDRLDAWRWRRASAGTDSDEESVPQADGRRLEEGLGGFGRALERARKLVSVFAGAVAGVARNVIEKRSQAAREA